MTKFKTPTNLGQSIATARKVAGLTQQELCQKIDISYSTLTKIERGAIKAPNAYTLAKIANITQTTIESLLALEDGQNLPKPIDYQSGATSNFGVKFVFIHFNSLLVGSWQSIANQIAIDLNLNQKSADKFFYQSCSDLILGNNSLAEFNQAWQNQFDLNKFDFIDYFSKQIKIHQDWSAILRWIYSYYPIGVVINGPEDLINCLLANCHLQTFQPQTIISSVNLKTSWPNQSFLREAQTKASPARPDQILLIDDQPLAIGQAASFNWQCLLIDQLALDSTISKIRQQLTFDVSKIKH